MKLGRNYSLQTKITPCINDIIELSDD